MFSPLFTGATALGSQAHSLVGNNSKFFMRGKVKDPQEGPHRLSPWFTLGLLLPLVLLSSTSALGSPTGAGTCEAPAWVP